MMADGRLQVVFIGCDRYTSFTCSRSPVGYSLVFYQSSVCELVRISESRYRKLRGFLITCSPVKARGLGSVGRLIRAQH